MAAKDFLNKRVVIENERGTRYAGVLVGFRENERQFCLGNLAIINRAGAYTVSGSYQTRWFDADKYKVQWEK